MSEGISTKSKGLFDLVEKAVVKEEEKHLPATISPARARFLTKMELR